MKILSEKKVSKSWYLGEWGSLHEDEKAWVKLNYYESIPFGLYSVILKQNLFPNGHCQILDVSYICSFQY